MTTRDELIDGFRMIIREGQRTTANFGPDDWGYTVHDEEGGWTVRQLYAHLTGVAEIMPGLVGALAQSAEDQNVVANVNIDDMNAQSVAAKAELSESELMEAFKKAHEAAVKFIQEAPDEQLQQQRRFGQIEAPVADLLETFFILHAISHIYHATSRPLN
ncbi:MAG: maleylpyruvate isomerase N-terminal domain-containing protein [Chloroflexi bacterium]|nr:maleylpyruvate isomerase N-terminal domain-containing protein [Chloroflexota bacterium]